MAELTPCQRDLAERREVAAVTGERMMPTPFDRIINAHAYDRLRGTKDAALAMCAECPVQPTCWRASRDEEWLQRLVRHASR